MSADLRPDLAKRAIADFIETNCDTLLDGIIHQGVQRRLGQIVTTAASPIVEPYYYVLVTCPDCQLEDEATARNSASPSAVAVYDLSITVADEALIQHIDTFPYQTMSEDFDLLCGRIVALLRSTRFVGTMKLTLDRRGAELAPIRRTELSGTWADEAGTLFASLYSSISFRMVQKCASQA